VPVTTRARIFFRGHHVTWHIYGRLTILLLLIDLTNYACSRIYDYGFLAKEIANWHLLFFWSALFLWSDYTLQTHLIPQFAHLISLMPGSALRGFPGSAHDGFTFTNPLSGSTEFEDRPDYLGNHTSLLTKHGFTHYRDNIIDEHVISFIITRRAGSQVIGNDNLQRFILSEIATEFPNLPLGLANNCAARAYQVLLCVRTLEDYTTAPARGGELPRVVW